MQDFPLIIKQDFRPVPTHYRILRQSRFILAGRMVARRKGENPSERT
jgi:hypothetical protein